MELKDGEARRPDKYTYTRKYESGIENDLRFLKHCNPSGCQLGRCCQEPHCSLVAVFRSLGESAGSIALSKDPLDDPAPWHKLETLCCVGSLDDSIVQ